MYLGAHGFSRSPGRAIPVSKDVQASADAQDFEIKAFKIPCAKEQVRAPRVVRVGAIQNKIVKETSAPILEQRDALFERIKVLIEAAGAEGVNVLCLQEAWSKTRGRPGTLLGNLRVLSLLSPPIH